MRKLYHKTEAKKMKITKERLRQIIQESLQEILNEPDTYAQALAQLDAEPDHSREMTAIEDMANILQNLFPGYDLDKKAEEHVQKTLDGLVKYLQPWKRDKKDESE